MKQLISYIIEKLTLNINSKSKFIHIDSENTELMTVIIKSVYISIFKNKTYKQRGIAQFTIKRSEINWEDVYDILSEEYNFTLYKNDLLQKHGELQTIVRKYLSKIENLMNMKTEVFKFSQKPDNYVVLKGFDIYQFDWRKYREKYNLK